MFDEWIVPHGQLPAIRANWLERETHGRLDVEVMLEDKRIITESFAGIGVGNEGVLNALQNFSVNSLHVFLAAFWQQNDRTEITIEQWQIAGKTYTAYIGNIGQRSDLNYSPALPADFFSSVEQAILQYKPSHDLTWYRVFFCDFKGEQTFEALAENQDWIQGVDALKRLHWEPSSGYYSVRNFIILKREKDRGWARIRNYFKN
ncbi:DUF6348 family protein [Acinetobacter higginsii]|uniref:DUF6348 family protein n=2 Tax=Acinetobacter TaxID=469 RepID=UPI001F4A83D5|nr:DUF6348 family protein [Acinetobacter higginsii]MCH7341666.1 DUF6348 family protein [Acinetobacter higginsii]